MSILAWLVVGFIAGFLARVAVPDEGGGGIIGDLIVGVVGAMLGGWIFTYLGHAGPSGINLYSIGVAFVGAVLLLLVLRTFTRARAY